jgi:Kef-type K+ transport system membrane component KefB
MADLIASSVFYEIAALLVLAAAVGMLGLLLRQPLIVSFIVVGIVAGPAGLDIARSSEHIELLADLGIAILLFLVGLKLDLHLVRTLGPVAVATGLGQVVFTSGIGFGLCLLLGLPPVASLYVAVALTFSSTIIIVKLLSDKREIDSLHGRIAVGFLIVQDLVVIVAMVATAALGAGAGRPADGDVVRIVAGGAGLLAGVGLFVRFLATPLVERLARAPELLVAFAIGWAVLLSAIGHWVGLSRELGGLLAGVSLASTPFREAIAARLATLRDFLLLFFFIALGAGLDLSVLGEQAFAAAVLSLFVLIGNPLIVIWIMTAMGYSVRTGFLAGLTVAQISEFSLVFTALGVSLGHVPPSVLGLVTLVGLVTIALSTYMITFSHPLHARLEPWLHPLALGAPRREAGFAPPPAGEVDAVVVGLGRFGGAIARRLAARGARVLGVDFDPVAIARWRDEGLPVCFGDASDPEFLASLPLARTRWVVSTVPAHATGITHDDHRVALLQALRAQGYAGRIAVTAHRDEEAEALRARGADLVLLPFQDAADQAVDLLESGERPARLEVIEPIDQEDLAG